MVFGVVFGLAGLGDPEDLGTVLVMAVTGAVFAAVGLSLATARAQVVPSGISYRSGLVRRAVPVQDVIGFGVGPGSGSGPERIAYVVERRDRRPVRLTGVQRWDTARARAEMTIEVSRAAALLGLPPADQR